MLIIRRSYEELKENHIEPLLKILNGVPGVSYNKTEHVLRFPNGSQIICGYCKDDSSAQRYQGNEYDVIFIDEATQLQEDWIKKIAASCRGVNGYPHRVIYTCNPGGVGHAYIKRVFVDRDFEENENPDDYVFIQSLVTDNKVLMENDPDYVRFLMALDPKLRKAWLEGDWDAFEGAYFETFRKSPDLQKCAEFGITPEEAIAEHKWVHVIPPFKIPSNWKIERSMDWGFGKPFSIGYWAVSDGSIGDIPGTIYRIYEWYGCTGIANEGLKLTNEEIFSQVRELEDSHPLLKGKKIFGVADPSMWDGSHDRDGVSAIDTAEKWRIWFEPGNNSRVAGWMQFRERLKFSKDGRAMIYFFDTCKDAIRTIPLMMYDEHKKEDLDTTLEDHACLSGDTLILTDRGYKTIEELVGTEGMVMSDDGQYHPYHNCTATREDALIYEFEMEDGTAVKATEDHLFLTHEGWKTVKEIIQRGLEIISINELQWTK